MGRMHGWIGRKDRHPVELQAVVHSEDGSQTPVTLSNFSDEGCRIEAEHEFLIAERLEIAIPGMGEFKAQVRWALPGSAGIQFLAEPDF